MFDEYRYFVPGDLPAGVPDARWGRWGRGERRGRWVTKAAGAAGAEVDAGAVEAGRDAGAAGTTGAIRNAGDAGEEAVDVAIAICEDLWQQGGPVAVTRQAGASLLVVPNASPYERGKDDVRLALCVRCAREAGATLDWPGSPDWPGPPTSRPSHWPGPPHKLRPVLIGPRACGDLVRLGLPGQP